MAQDSASLAALPVLKALADAVDALRSLGESGDADEVQHQYARTFELAPARLNSTEFGQSVRALVAAGFQINLTIEAYSTRWLLEATAPGVQATVMDETIEGDLPDLAADAFVAFEELQQAIAASATVSIPTPLFDRAAARGLPIRISLSTVLYKASIQTAIESDLPSAARVILCLFPARLAQVLEKTPLADLEKDYFTAGKRTVFLVPGMQGLLTGELVAVCGQDRAADLNPALASPLLSATQQRIKDAIVFFDLQCDSAEKLKWLTPETFSIPLPEGRDPAAATLKGHLFNLQSLLGVLFLARRIRTGTDGRYEINFGISPGEVITIDRSSLAASEVQAADLLKLYRFAYDGSSTDKLEIVRQLLAPVRDAAALFAAAPTVLKAAETTYGRLLKKMVDEYFAARRKTRDYVQEAVQDAESSIVKMTQEVAENVYKTFGAIALVVIARLVDPKLTPLAAFLAAVALALYMCVVLFYYLQAVGRAQLVLMHQFNDHIHSFKDVLGKKEATGLLNNKRVKQARKDFRIRRYWANAIYGFLLVVALLAAAYYGHRVATEPPAADAAKPAPAPGATPQPLPRISPGHPSR